ncbi:MAG: AAA family ATPase, partial [Limisphaerales bacterium]
MAGQKIACPTCGAPTLLRTAEPPRIRIPPQRRQVSRHAEPADAGIAPVARKIIDNVERVVIGKHQEVVFALVSFFSEGHLLIEDVPGVAKTMLARALAQSVGCSFKRIQCTPDLLPNDITGASVFNPKTTDFEFRRGPLFAQIVLADEINRTTPRTQSALLEAMSERQVTVDGTIYSLQQPFFLIATQNPVDHEGTFSLPEAQLDRFLMRIRLGYPSLEAEQQMMDRLQRGHPIESLEPVASADEVVACQKAVREIHVDLKVREYVLQIVRATRENSAVILGGSPRASLALFHTSQALAAINGFNFVLQDDVKQMAHLVLDHRLILKPENRLRKMTAASV